MQDEIEKNVIEEIKPMLPDALGQSQADQTAHGAVSAQFSPERQALISARVLYTIQLVQNGVRQ